jgi:sulfoxide reductase heme-binding subunit YedZ
MKTPHFGKFVLWTLLSLPLLFLGYAWQSGLLVYGELLHLSGEFSARLLVVTMAITPLRLMFPKSGWSAWLLMRRRNFGVATFAYALLHTLVYVSRKQSLSLILDEGIEFSMWTGWAAFLVFLVLALTSNDASPRILRRTWKKIHRAVYVAAFLAFAHWIFIAFDFVPGLIHFVILLTLEIYRLWKRRKLVRHEN